MLDFILIFKAAVIAIVEALTEFLPVSSTGHEILVGRIINFYDTKYSTMYMIVIQLAAIMAIVVLYWDTLWNYIKDFFAYLFTLGRHGKKGFKFWINLLVGSIPALIVGGLFHSIIKKKLFNINTVTIGFIVGGFLLVIIENIYLKRKKYVKTIKNIESVSYKQAFTVGVFQCLSMWPGMSRSASTIIGGWLADMDTPLAAEFSFFLAIPALFGASFVGMKDADFLSMTSSETAALIIGCIICFICAYYVVAKFIDYLRKKPMKIFAYYRISMGVVLMVLVLKKII